MLDKKKLLWIGDSPHYNSEYSRITKDICNILKNKYDLKVLGFYNNSYEDIGYTVIDALEPGADALGMQKLINLVRSWKPDYVIILNNPLIVSQYSTLLYQNCIYKEKVYTDEEKKALTYASEKVLERISNTQIFGYICMNTEIIRKNIIDVLNQTLDHAIVLTDFAYQQFKKNNFTKPLTKVSLGFISTFKVYSKKEARNILGVSENAFIIYSGYRNQPDKRLDILLKGYLDFLKKYPEKDIILMLNCGMVGTGWDILRLYQTLAEEIDIKDWDKHLKLTVAHAEDPLFDDQTLSVFYSAVDVGVCTSHGEFYGLPSIQLASYGCPQIVPNFAALGELFQQGAIRINPVESYIEPITTNVSMGLGKVIRAVDLTKGLEIYYTNEEQLKKDGSDAKDMTKKMSWISSLSSLIDHI